MQKKFFENWPIIDDDGDAIKILFFGEWKFTVIRVFRNQCILGDTDGYWGSYGF